MSGRFTDRVAIVTGGGRGIGEATALRLASEGAAVAIGELDLDAARSVVAAIEASGGRAIAVRADVASADDMRALAAATADAFGPADVLVNNAGIAQTERALEVTPQDWERVVGTNLTGAFTVAQAVARRMVAAEVAGAIVNIASILGERVAGGVAPYAISKAGVIQMTKALALELARHSIRVNALAPGYVETDLNRDFFASEAGQAIVRRVPQRRIGQLADLDGPLLLLASDASAFMTGSVVAVDGGHLVSGL